MSAKSKILRDGYTITAILFCLILLYFFLSLCLTIPDIQKHIQKDINGTILNEDLEAEDEPEVIAPTPSLMKLIFKSTENAINKVVPNRMFLIDVNGLVQRFFNKSLIPEPNENNNVFRMTNGQLTYTYPDIGVRIAHKNFSVLNRYLDSVGTNLIYIQAPYKINKYNNQLPYGLTDFPNQNADKLIEGLYKLQIDTIDYRDVFATLKTNYNDLFFNTDHHWKTETAFFAYQYLLDYLKTSYGFSYNPKYYELKNFESITLKQSFIGSLANRVGRYYTGIDDFTFIYPTFDTHITYMKYDEQGLLSSIRTGSFYESVFYNDRMSQPNTPLPYRDNCYFNGNPALGRIINHMVPEGKVLFVQDSFGKPLASFMALNFHEVDTIDLRDYKEDYLIDFIKNDHYDYVFILYNPSALKRSTYYRQFRFYDYD